MKRFFFGLIITVLFSSCTSVRVIKYPKATDDDAYVNYHLLEYFRANKHPKVVLRVSNDKATGNTVTLSNSSLYNTIENELVSEGFSVRDRSLFNDVRDKSQAADYAKISEETDTDLILEVQEIHTDVLYSTDTVTIIKKKRNDFEIQPGNSYQTTGFSIEFRWIIVKGNEVSGHFKFNYNPCPDKECPIDDWVLNKQSKKLELRKTISTNTLKEFITRCTQDLVKSCRS